MEFKPRPVFDKPKPISAPTKRSQKPLYVINGEQFFTKDALKKRVVWIAEKNKYGKVEDVDQPFMKAFVRLHREADNKIGVGVDYISVVPNARKYDSWSFVITRVDGTSIDFSYIACLEPKNHKLEAIKAFRDEVTDQRADFIRKYTEAHGNHTGERLIAHHDPSFMSLVEAFVRELPLLIEFEDLETYEPDTTESSCGMSALVNRDIAEAWKAFHLERARFRAVTQREHDEIHYGKGSSHV